MPITILIIIVSQAFWLFPVDSGIFKAEYLNSLNTDQPNFHVQSLEICPQMWSQKTQGKGQFYFF